VQKLHDLGFNLRLRKIVEREDDFS